MPEAWIPSYEISLDHIKLLGNAGNLYLFWKVGSDPFCYIQSGTIKVAKHQYYTITEKRIVFSWLLEEE